jgi:putative transposase
MLKTPGAPPTSSSNNTAPMPEATPCNAPSIYTRQATLLARRYLAAVVDWFSRRVLAWRLSITMEVEFCLDAVEEALAGYGRPAIFNTDQGSQFTSAAFTGLLLENSIAISMDGRGSWRDSVFVERLWRSVKYEEVYLRAYDSVGAARASLGRHLDFYNRRRPHSSLDARTPEKAYFDHLPQRVAA